MPTGYTSIIDDTEGDVPLRAYAIRCAHAFGALIHRRDSGFEDDIPDTVAPLAGDYHVRSHREAVDALARLGDMTAAACNAKAREEHASACREFARSRKESAVAVAKYEAMRAKVLAWAAPPECAELRSFMLSQLDVGAPYLFTTADPALVTGAGWRTKETARLKRDVAYHAEYIAKDEERAEKATAWLRALRESLAAVEERTGKAE